VAERIALPAPREDRDGFRPSQVFGQIDVDAIRDVVVSLKKEIRRT
jgi:hypothetical protein